LIATKKCVGSTPSDGTGRREGRSTILNASTCLLSPPTPHLHNAPLVTHLNRDSKRTPIPLQCTVTSCITVPRTGHAFGGHAYTFDGLHARCMLIMHTRYQTCMVEDVCSYMCALAQRDDEPAGGNIRNVLLMITCDDVTNLGLYVPLSAASEAARFLEISCRRNDSG
jgi:hypothetical protein